ncbi:hypothetical protein HDU79_006157, partial [Rhizoclosmatium sp. JEL0117]
MDSLPTELIQSIFCLLSPVQAALCRGLSKRLCFCLSHPDFLRLNFASISSNPKWPSDLDVAWLSWKTDQLSSVYAHVVLSTLTKMEWHKGLVTKPRKSHLKRRIPSSIILVTKLTHLNLSMSQISGLIPKALSLCISLIHIDISTNALTGPIPSFRYLEHLQHLALEGNKFTGPIPNGLPDSITHLSLSQNKLSGEIPQLPAALILFTANRNNLTGPLPETLPSTLDHLDISQNRLTGHIPASICTLTSLTNLILHTNNLSGDIPSDMHRMTSLRHVNFSKNTLVGSLPPLLGEIEGLLRFMVYGNDGITKEVPES